MSSLPNVVHSRKLTDGESGELIRFSREGVQWEWMSMSARRLKPGESYSAATKGEEAAYHQLSQNATIRRASVAERIGIRSDSNLRDEC